MVMLAMKLKDQNMVEGQLQTSSKRSRTSHCEGYTFAKQHRLPFFSADSKSSTKLELVHMDVCGPIEEEPAGEAKYLATFTDD